MKTSEIRELTIEEIDKKIEDSRQELFNLRVQAKLGQIEKPSKIKEIKREIARMITIKEEIIQKKGK